jgi:hypothetical protein
LNPSEQISGGVHETALEGEAGGDTGEARAARRAQSGVGVGAGGARAECSQDEMEDA